MNVTSGSRRGVRTGPGLYGGRLYVGGLYGGTLPTYDSVAL